MKRLLTARRAFRRAIPCRDTRHLHYTASLTGDSVGVLLIVAALTLAALIALMGG